ncbi:MAG TPA: hypothetical protein VEA69_20560 [Tepidisphaeraceae bacterium]|nr:hypothetical protein [Tepidisphaeraceae bacterium]
MTNREINLLAVSCGALLMLFALGNSLVTLASQDYRGVLSTALVAAILGLCVLAVPLVRGPAPWRVAAVLCAMPAAFVLSDFVGRFRF